MMTLNFLHLCGYICSYEQGNGFRLFGGDGMGLSCAIAGG